MDKNWRILDAPGEWRKRSTRINGGSERSEVALRARAIRFAF
jgi:hypothetical protein